MNLITNIKQTTAQCINTLYGISITPEQVLVNATKPEFEGDYTIVLFAFVKQLGKSPDALGQELGSAIKEALPETVTDFNIVKGFLNLSISNSYWLGFVKSLNADNLIPTIANPKKLFLRCPKCNGLLVLGEEYSTIIFLGFEMVGNKLSAFNDFTKPSQ